MSFPDAFDLDIYKNYNKLHYMSDAELYNHYNYYGRHEGLTSSSITNRTIFFDLINKDKLILEIGPLCFPISNVNNKNVKVLDYFSREELINNYKNDSSVIIENIVNVDYVCRNYKLYSDFIDIKFDYCISSHNIEHAPCTITFLKNISSILMKNGFIFLAVPDCRFCFDRFKPRTTIFDTLKNYFNKTDKPQDLSLLYDKYFATHNYSSDHWEMFSKQYQNIFVNINEQEDFMISKKDNIINDINIIKKIIEDNNQIYIDSHCQRFTPFSFEFILDILYETNLIDLKIERLYKTLKGSNEFYVILKKI